jgi:hypothetical protein
MPFLDPASTVSNSNWTASGAATIHASLDAGTRDPTAPAGAEKIVATTGVDNDAKVRVAAGTGTYPALMVHVYLGTFQDKGTGTATFTATLVYNGVEQLDPISLTTDGAGTVRSGWLSGNFGGGFDLSVNTDVRLRCDDHVGSRLNALEVYEVYIEYAASGTNSPPIGVAGLGGAAFGIGGVL